MSGPHRSPQARPMSRIYGPFYVRINHFGMATASTIDGGVIQNSDDMFNDAVAAGASFTNFYNNESALISQGLCSHHRSAARSRYRSTASPAPPEPRGPSSARPG